MPTPAPSALFNRTHKRTSRTAGPKRRLSLSAGQGLALARTAALLGVLVAVGGCSNTPAAPQRVPCERLDEALAGAFPSLQVHSAQRVSQDEQGHPPHCRLQATLWPAGQHGPIGFELRLPATWNQRFLHQANGGTDGVVKPAFGQLAVLQQDALTRGFAVISSDGGHTADDPAQAEAGLARGVQFGLSPQARRDFAYGALDALWPLAQATLHLHYGQAPLRNYLAGCGNGGRLGLVAASRWPERYDGILAGAPALYWPGAALQAAWDQQQWRSAAADARDALSPEDLRLVAAKVVERCDPLDMVADGMVGNLARCQRAFRLIDLQCRGAKTAQCLRPAQVQALQAVMGGPRDSQGNALYTDWPVDAGIGSTGWRQWRLASNIEGWGRQPVAATIGAAQLAYLFSTPPQAVAGNVPDLLGFLQQFDLDAGGQRARAVQAPFTEALPELLQPLDVHEPRLAGLAQRQGKLIVYHGASDPAFSVNATLGWAERLQSQLGLEQANRVARVYAVPGMGHCQGGPATDRFDALGALVDWVEKDQAPDRLLAQVNPANPELPAAWSKARSRPLCPWPQIARYAGGDVEAAASFRCAMP